MKKLFFLVSLVLFSFGLSAQLTQTIRGTIVDKESKFPLIGVNVILDNSASIKGTTSDINGKFELTDIAIGRNTLKFSYIGYKESTAANLIVSSAKEVILHIEMEESLNTLKEVVITANKSGGIINEMATVSARTFSVKETEKYAGSRGEPARMASNFAGVQGADDSRNDIIIRGNSPQTVLWRLEGFNIPNPNHFSIPGTGGGPVTILNNKFLSNSDFFTGAFPAEYANGIGGVFDLKMRNGNNQHHEFSAQLGFLGTELMAEGPLSKSSGASYLATYRYSTLSLFSFLGIKVGTDAIPKYQDGSFRFNFPFKDGSNISFFGIAGKSNIDIVLSEAERPDTSTIIYGSNDRDQYFGSQMGIVGMTYTKPLNPSTYIKAGISASNQRVKAFHDQIFRHVDTDSGLFVVDSLPRILGYTFNENKYSAYGFVNKKINKKSSLKYGINLDVFDLNYLDSVRMVNGNIDNPNQYNLEPWRKRWNSSDLFSLVQPYIHYKYKYSDKLIFTAGITSTLVTINKNSISPFEPRAGLKYKVDKKSSLNFGVGYHSQMQSNYLYYFGNKLIDGKPDTYNLNMGLSKSAHVVIGYDRFVGSKLHFKIETYAQKLFNLPVEVEESNFSIINAGSGFSRLFPNPLQNKGTGINYGLEFTLEKYFSKGYYFLVTGSLFDSKYRGSNNQLRNTSYNGNYVANALFAKEIVFNKKNSLSIGGKFTYAGGRRYGDVNRDVSAIQLEVIYEENNNYNAYQFRDYFRGDIKVNYRINSKGITHELALDLVNVFNIQNILTLTYAPDHPIDPVVEEYQLGFLPLFYYRIDF